MSDSTPDSPIEQENAEIAETPKIQLDFTPMPHWQMMERIEQPRYGLYALLNGLLTVGSGVLTFVCATDTLDYAYRWVRQMVLDAARKRRAEARLFL
jgi:hypothetical protein